MARKVSALTVMLALVAACAAAQADETKAVVSAWNRVKRLNAAAAAAMPEGNYAFKPTPEVRSFGQIVGHLVNDHYNLCSQVKGEANPQKAVDFEKTTAKADLLKALGDSIAYCDRAESALKNDKAFTTFLLNVTHDSEHYGNFVTYLRMKGVVPPSSQPSR